MCNIKEYTISDKVKINGNDVEFIIYTGKILSIKEWIHRIGPNQTKRISEIWIARDNNKEKFFKFVNFLLPMREGHILTIISYKRNNDKFKNLEIINNEDGSSVFFGIDCDDKNMFNSSKIKMLNIIFFCCLLASLISVFYLKWIIACIFLFGSFYIKSIRNKLFKNKLYEFYSIIQKKIKDEKLNINFWYNDRCNNRYDNLA